MKEKKIVGVIVKSKFITHTSDKFNSYINYMNRAEAIRNDAYSRYSLYSDYMGNPKKTNGLFDKEKDILSKNDIKIEGVCAGAAIYSTKALEAVKLDDENYFDSNFFAYFEDVDLSLRLKDAGFKAKLLKDSIVYHMHSATGGKTTGFKEYYLTRNLFMYTKRNQTIEQYNKHKKEYYIRFLKTVVKNISNFNAVKSAVKGLNDGLKESKKIEYWKIQ